MSRINTLLLLAVAGTLFSGYLSFTKLLTGACALGQTCPLFLGYPACWFGFVMFSALLVVSGLGAFDRIGVRTAYKADMVVATIGIIFSGYFVWVEAVAGTLVGGSLGLSSCVWGLAFFAAMFVISFRGR